MCTLKPSYLHPAGAWWRLHVHKQRSRPCKPWTSRQDGEFLPGWNSEVPVPALLWWHGAAQFRQVHLQYRGPPSPYMALSTQVILSLPEAICKDQPQWVLNELKAALGAHSGSSSNNHPRWTAVFSRKPDLCCPPVLWYISVWALFCPFFPFFLIFPKENENVRAGLQCQAYLDLVWQTRDGRGLRRRLGWWLMYWCRNQ